MWSLCPKIKRGAVSGTRAGPCLDQTLHWGRAWRKQTAPLQLGGGWGASLYWGAVAGCYSETLNTYGGSACDNSELTSVSNTVRLHISRITICGPAFQKTDQNGVRVCPLLLPRRLQDSWRPWGFEIWEGLCSLSLHDIKRVQRVADRFC